MVVSARRLTRGILHYQPRGGNTMPVLGRDTDGRLTYKRTA